MLYERIVDSRLLVRRLTVIADDVATPEELAAGKRYEQLDLFGDDEAQYGPSPLMTEMVSMISSVRCWM